MSWYRAGTVTVTNGSATVIGAGTDFVANTQIGHGFRGPDGRVYEISGVVSATQITLAEPYLSGSGGGQVYAIMPTQSFARDLALGAAELLNSFAFVRDGVGQGLFADGTAAAPGVRFAADQDTGVFRSGANEVGISTGGLQRARFNAGGLTLFSDYMNVTGAELPNVIVTRNGIGSWFMGGAGAGDNDFTIRYNSAAPALRIAPDGSVAIRGNSGSRHVIASPVAQAQGVLNIESTSGVVSAVFCAVGAYAPNGAGSALYLGRDTNTLRSLNATGTVNASGADYAEYMVKAAGCGMIAKGDVCGVDRDGRLTKTWADAISFVIKSTDPSLVGGDTYGQSVGPRPEGPGEEPGAPIAPPGAPISEDEADVAAWRAIVAAYPAQQAAHQSEHAAWTTAKAAYDTALPAWEAALEAERQKVDRIAFAGQVPVNVTGDFAVGDYIVAVASGAGIKAAAVSAADITFEQYRRRIGKIWAVRDGRAWVDVQHG